MAMAVNEEMSILYNRYGRFFLFHDCLFVADSACPCNEEKLNKMLLFLSESHCIVIYLYIINRINAFNLRI
jgi:hypothetical protein